MCHNKEISITTFLIGTILNIYLFTTYSNPIVKLIAIMWEYILLMQLIEFFVWLDQTKSNFHKITTRITLLLNLLQPVIILFIMICMSPYQDRSKNILSLSLLTIYIGYMFLILYNDKEPVEYLTPTDTCNHLDYKWWSTGNYGVIYYLLPIIVSVFLYIKPLSLSVFQNFYILITIVLSYFIYGCGIPSIWCWLAAFAPLFTLIFLKSSHIK
jgi:hypothetical protein